MMINVFYKNRNTIGQFMVALIFLGTFGFLFTYDGFVSESQASGCCGGGEAAVTSFAADSSGDYGGGIPMDAPITGGCCSGEDKVIPSSNNNDDDDPCDCLFEPGPSENRECGSCAYNNECGGPATGCDTGCPCSHPCCYDGQKCKGSLCEGKGCS